MKTILSISHDQILLETRAAILRRSGHRVVSVRDVSQFAEASRDEAIDLVIVGHTLSPEERENVYRNLADTHCECPIIELYASAVPPHSPAHFHLAVHDQTFQTDLLLLVRQVLSSEGN